MPSEPIDDTHIDLWEIVFPHHANHLGTLFGGQALAWMDKAAFLLVARLHEGVHVTARSEAVDFIVPVRVGDAVRIRATEAKRGQRSVHVDVSLHVGRESGRIAAQGRFVMVRIS